MGPKFNLHHLPKFSAGFTMAVLTPKLGISDFYLLSCGLNSFTFKVLYWVIFYIEIKAK